METELYQDKIIKATYIHGLADVIISLLAIITLFFGKKINQNWVNAFGGVI